MLAADPASRFERMHDYNGYMTAAAAAGFDYLLVCNAQLLKEPFPPQLQLIARSAHFALLRAPGAR